MADVARLGAGIGLVGRRRELSALTGALDRARGGAPTGVLVSGDAGVGKSRLVAEAVATARAAGFAVVTGRCLDTAESLPYLPFTEVVCGLSEVAPEIVERHEALRYLMPGAVPGEVADVERDLGQVRLFDAVLSTLDALTAHRPALLVLEDLHWADRSSRDLLVFLLSRLSGQQLVVVATYRADDLHRRHPLRPVLAELVRLPAVERLDLEPLGPEASLRLVRALSDGALSPQELAGIARRSGGNAFFAEELVSAETSELPHSLVDVLLTRVEGLPAAARAVLQITAVAGGRVAHADLAAVSGLSDDELDGALGDAVNHNVLVPDPASPEGVSDDGYTFRHALLREAIDHDLLPGRRSRLHAAFARLLSAGPPTQPPDRPGLAARLAHHAFAAHDLPGALAASTRAAIEAAGRNAPAEMLLHAERALDLWPAVPDAERVAGHPEFKLTRMAAWAASTSGDPDRGAALAHRALELAELRGDQQLTASIRLRYAVRLLEPGGDKRRAREAALKALPVFESGPPSGDLAWTHAVLARVHYWLDEFDDCEARALDAIAIAEAVPPDAEGPRAGEDPPARPGDPITAAGKREWNYAQSAAADALVTLASRDEFAGRSELGRERLARAKELAQRVGALTAELRAYSSAGYSLIEECRFPEAARELAEGEQRAAATGLRWSTPGLDVRVAHVVARFLGGEWDDAERAAEMFGAAVPARISARLVGAGLLVAAARGRFDHVEQRYAELAPERPTGGQAVLNLTYAATETALWQGRSEVALRRAVEGERAVVAEDPTTLSGICLSALAVAALAQAVAAGRAVATAGGPVTDPVALADELVEKAEHAARTGLPRGLAMGPEGHAWLRRAHAERTRLTGPDPAAWDAVVAAFSYEPSPAGAPDGTPGYRTSYALLRRAEARLTAHLAAPPGQELAADLRAAHACALALRAGPLRDAVADLAARAGVALGEPAAAPRPVAGTDPLTPRERAVLEQVALGHTNRQVGTTLFISEKTVSVHLSRVMAKLGATSRTEAVSLAYARGLLTPDITAPTG